MKKLLFLMTTLMFVGSAIAKDRAVVAVLDFTNETRAHWWQTDVGRELGGMLANELVSTGAFKVVERNKLDSVLGEQDLGASGRVSKASAAKMGQVTGAQYLITGNVAAYDENTKGTGGGIGFKGISIGGKSSKAYLAIDLRVVNATTGEVEYVRTVEGHSKGGGMSLGFSRSGFGGSLGGHKKTPAGKAIRAALIEATDYLACVMYDQDSCMKEYRDKERERRKKSKSALSLD
ncbi:CsgG/HfaB family protein [Marinicella sp. S1101]|uniref:CsgG/HfaB family protein n=1 Tax=Marinicella marina TaxID=2996016 RepID=UPI002260D5FA|nr:CsgG/HfaB family protein [Marinicella marina]MCX7554005.1 CsgG/HfaB family protein [Marinicella marina]MDJ1140497.1 CsgG/HfaB family protein [Marinicella marina]